MADEYDMTNANEVSSAANRVFDVPELLESILLHTLEPHTGRGQPDEKVLLLAQRVNTSFRSCILGSPEIQRRLGFRLVHGEGDGLVNNFIFKAGSYYYLDIVSIDGLEWFYYGYVWTIRTYKIRFGQIDQYRLREALASCSSSWLDMYPQQYTGKHIALEIDTSHPWLKSNYRMTVKLRPLRDLIELAMSFWNVAKYLERISPNDCTEEDNKDFEWKKFFTEEQLETIVEEPDFCDRLV